MRKVTMVAVLGVLALTAVACGDDGDTTDAGSEGPPASEQADTAATVSVAEGDLGDILVDGEGRTLYVFSKDEPDTSTCVDDCAENWPPLEAPDELVAGEGTDEELLGTITRDDGTSQVTYASMPLYLYAGDAAPGETNGQGVGDVWYVVGPDGAAIMPTPSSIGDY